MARLLKARGKRYSVRRRFFTFETLNPTEMNHEGQEDHEEIVFVCFCAFCGYLEERGRSRRYARFVSGRVWICFARVIRPRYRYRYRPRFTPLLFDPDTDTDPDPDSHTHTLTHTHPPTHTHLRGHSSYSAARRGRRCPTGFAHFSWAFVMSISLATQVDPAIPKRCGNRPFSIL